MLVKHGTETCDENRVSGVGRNALALDASKVATRCLGLLAAVIIYVSFENIPSRVFNYFYVFLGNFTIVNIVLFVKYSSRN